MNKWIFKWEPYKRWFEGRKKVNNSGRVYGLDDWVDDDNIVNQHREHSKWNLTRDNEFNIKYNRFEMPVEI